jgi:hypothetical protein
MKKSFLKKTKRFLILKRKKNLGRLEKNLLKVRMKKGYKNLKKILEIIGIL